MVLQIFGRRASEGDGRLNEVRVSAVAAGKAIAAIEGLAQRRVQVPDSLMGWAKGMEGMNKKPLFAMGTALTAVILAGHPNPVCAGSTVVSFKEDVFPILKGRCIECHQPTGQGYEKSGLDLTTYEGLMKGTKYGSMVAPGNPDSSNLMWLLDWKASPELNMPHGKKQLSTCDRDAIREWIRQGAKDN